MSLTPSQLAAVRKAKQECVDCDKDITFIEKVAEVDPTWAERARTLRELQDWIAQVSECCLAYAGEGA